MIINIVDAFTGFGKTTAAINFMNKYKNDEDKKFLYITPYLDEVKRIKENCKGFTEPQLYGSKMKDIQRLFINGKNIVSTHALFRLFNEEIIDIASLQNYILIMDEVADVVEPLPITKQDLENILDKFVIIDDDGFLEWSVKDYTGKYEEYKRLCDLKCLMSYKTAEGNRVILLWAFPVNIFRAFKEIYVLTYMFDGQIQKYYYDYYGCEYKKWYVKNTNTQGENDLSKYALVDEVQDYDLSYVKDLIDICQSEKINMIGDKDFSLSSSWYDRNKENGTFDILKNNTTNYFRNIAKGTSSNNIWTTYKEYANSIKGAGYSKGFVSINMRATNKYSAKHNVAYLVNIFLNPYIKNFFLNKGIAVDENKWALSEIVQFIWRSAIRKREHIKAYIPSKRMRNLLKEWMI